MKSSFKNITLAIVCGQESMVKQIKQELETKYGITNFVDISSDSGGRTNTKKVKAKLRRCDFVCVIPSYVGHGITNIIYKLNRANSFDGKLLKIQGGKGKTAILRQIIDCASLAA